MSTSQAADLWGLHQDTIKRLCRTGKIAAIKLDSDDPKSPYLILRNQPSPINKDTV
ncbi:helix-turn-helix domain-containing protein [Heyndrickxia oleronia]|uniref:helix-turn-helix domain-containing protein n=1 Tax=Heyndrickxia oleronia TaxID=38875 RepID=UPI00137AB855